VATHFYRADRDPTRREGSDRRRRKKSEEVFKVALAVSLEAVFQTSLGFIDQIIVGTLGATAVAAVGRHLSSCCFIRQLERAPACLVAQAFGRNDLNEVSKVAAPV
jgi:Na+-driven multidrug efflux pump